MDKEEREEIKKDIIDGYLRLDGWSAKFAAWLDRHNLLGASVIVSVICIVYVAWRIAG
jgi:hypothetical protein